MALLPPTDPLLSSATGMFVRRSILSAGFATGLLGLAPVVAGCGSSDPGVDECISSWNANVPANQPYGHELFGVMGILQSSRHCVLGYRDPKGRRREFERRGDRFQLRAFAPHEKIVAKTATQVSVDTNGHLSKVGHAQPTATNG